jgi:tetratricopeptide (TPR) repeat protein
MSSSARIDELRKKFDENPRRFFAPLANEYRKAGDFEQAVFICQEYLPQQPGHMSGHIVYGQTLFDMGRDEEAKAVFETALTLDPENLIALKHLGDIARQADDLEGARSWYQRVLEADPRNDEIMLVLESLGGAEIGLGADAAAQRASDAQRLTPISVAEVQPPEFESTADMLHDDSVAAGSSIDASVDTTQPDILVLEQSIDAEMPVAEPEMMAFAVEFESSDRATSDHRASDDRASDDRASDDRSSDEEPPEATSHELLDVDDFSFGAPQAASETPSEAEPIAAAESIDLEFAAEPAVDDSAHDSPVPEPDIELATDVILGLTDDAPEATSEQPIADLAVEPTPVATEALTHAIDQLAGLETFSMDVPAEAPASAPDEPAMPANPDTFATETMADLYAQQGHLESALEIYEQLLEQSPDDTELRRLASDVETRLYGAPEADVEVAEPAGESIVASLAVETFADAGNTDAETVAETATPVSAGPTIREFFAELLRGRNAEGSDAVAAAEGTEPAELLPPESEGSLDILFSDVPTADADLSAAMSLAQAFGGEDERDDAAALHGTPAHPATDELSLDHVFRSTTPAKGSAAGGAFSLDQFFAGEMANADASEGSSEGPPRSNDDIAQFNAWLNGLKKT